MVREIGKKLLKCEKMGEHNEEQSISIARLLNGMKILKQALSMKTLEKPLKKNMKILSKKPSKKHLKGSVNKAENIRKSINPGMNKATRVSVAKGKKQKRKTLMKLRKR